MERSAKPKTEKEFEMVRELVRVCFETLLRCRKVPLHTVHRQTKRGPRSLWFNLQSEVLTGVENMVNAEWRPNRTLIVTFSLESILLESWTIRYAPLQQDSAISTAGMPVMETRYFASTLLVRQLIVVAEALPATKNGSTEYTCQFVESGEEAMPMSFLSEEFAFPGVDMAFGKVFIQVRYRADFVPRSSAPKPLRENIGSLAAPSQMLSSVRIMEDYFTNKLDANEDEEEENEEADMGDQRWKRWTVETFDERERQLQQEEEEEVAAAPQFVRQTSNPMNIKPTSPGGAKTGALRHASAAASMDPPKRQSTGISAPEKAKSAPQSYRRLSGNGSYRRRLGSGSAGKEDFGLVAEMMGSPPNSSTLPHILGSLTGSANSSELRSRFLSISANSSPVFSSSNSLMIYNKPTPPVFDLSKQTESTVSMVRNNNTVAVNHREALLYESALPWILTAAEMERPFSGLSGSIFVGAVTAVADSKAVVAATPPSLKPTMSPMVSKDNFASRFGEDEEDSFASSSNPTSAHNEEDELGRFLVKCREAPGIFAHEPTVNLQNVRAEFVAMKAGARSPE